MVLTGIVLFIFFVPFAIHGWAKFILSTLGWFHSVMWFVSMIITAIAVGMIWGGLFQ